MRKLSKTLLSLLLIVCAALQALSRERRAFVTVLAFTGLAGLVTAQRRDTTNDASLSFNWEPYRFLLLSASLQNARRSSSAAGLDYNSNTVNINAQFTY